MADKLVQLMFSEKNTRGVVFNATTLWEELTKNQKLPAPVKTLLGKLTAGALMLSAGLKFNGALVLQLQGDGPVKLAIVEVRTGLLVRATAQLRVKPEEISPTTTFKDLVNANGLGRCAVILDAADRRVGEQPYQGLVALDNAGVEATLENYMTHSEQLKTRIWLAASDAAIGGVLLQALPKTGGTVKTDTVSDEESEKGFDEVVLFGQTVKDSELLSTDATDLARHLFWEDNPRVVNEATPRFQCRCSKAAIDAMVKSLGKATDEEIIEEKGAIEVTCEFCGKHYKLDKIDVAALFENGTTEGSTATKH